MARPKKPVVLSEEKQRRKDLAESDLEEFIHLVAPRRMLGNIHREVIRWWTRADAKKYQLLLLPRDHMKSALMAYRVAWTITKDPTVRILYISSTSNLAVKQLKFIKDILTSDIYRQYWPEMINKDEAKREKWTEREISVDHPKRKLENIRDPTIFTAGLTSNIVGLHCTHAVLDDVVVESNAYIEDVREKVYTQYSYLTSIEGTDACEWVTGTRYHPKDLYAIQRALTYEEHDDLGNVKKSIQLFEVLEYPVESVGDGTGEFLWPRTQSPYGQWYGFDSRILAEKRSKYINKLHFRAQYYNDPHDLDSSPIQRDLFQYYEREFLFCKDGRWYFKGNRLNVFAAVDFAYSLGRTSDYTAIVVVGVDGQGNYYILEIDRFKTDKISDYFTKIIKSYEKWGFIKIRAETTAAQVVLIKDFKENYIRRLGLSLVVDEFKPSRFQGSKEERINAALEPKYANRQMWHYRGGNCQTLEEELVMHNPPHDDIKDALANAVDLAVAPANMFRLKKDNTHAFNFHAKFGGVT